MPPHPFHFFGDLWLEDPNDYLSSKELAYLQDLLPLIKCLESDGHKALQPARSGFDWNLDQAFEKLVISETQWWKSRGVERSPQFMVKPEGSLNARVACHLYNPTFCVADPFTPRICDSSNPSISQIQRAGFTTENGFFFDHFPRRDESQHVDDCYPEDLCNIYNHFLSGLRNVMGAVVEVCWGMRVRQRMQRLYDLKPLDLWGSYQGVTVYLELSTCGAERSLRRFILFVRHPQCYAYVKSMTDRAQNFRTANGRKQDLILKVSSLIGKIEIESHFYEYSPNLLRPGFRESAQRRLQRAKLQGEARAQLQSAFPGVVLRTSKKDSYSALLTQIRKDVSGLSEVRAGGIVSLNPETRADSTIDETQRACRFQRIASFWNELEELIASFLPGVEISARAHNAEKRFAIDTLLMALEGSDWTDIFEWDELPEELSLLLTDQEGLRVDQAAISSRADLERTCQLLQVKEGITHMSIVALAFLVLFAYGWKLSRPRKKSLDSLLVLQAPPQNIMPRKCSGCGERVLDDPYAYYAKCDPTNYVTWGLENGCGLPHCVQRHVQLIPLEDYQHRVPPLRQSLLALENRDATWQRYFLRLPGELGDLPTSIRMSCSKCGAEIVSSHPRWTSHDNTPKFVIQIRTCPSCKKPNSSFRPCDKSIPVVNSSSLIKLWNSFKKAGVNLEEYPRIPQHYFSKGPISLRVSKLTEARGR